MNVDLPDIYNAATTFVDDNIAQGRGERIAIFYQDRKFTYQEVFEKVNRTGNALKELSRSRTGCCWLCPTPLSSHSVSLAPSR
jgi:acyl-coenzyme A synthetase/AMP-(fatty) acid ligase